MLLIIILFKNPKCIIKFMVLVLYSSDEAAQIAKIAIQLGEAIQTNKRAGYGDVIELVQNMSQYSEIFRPVLRTCMKEQDRDTERFCQRCLEGLTVGANFNELDRR